MDLDPTVAQSPFLDVHNSENLSARFVGINFIWGEMHSVLQRLKENMHGRVSHNSRGVLKSSHVRAAAESKKFLSS